MLLVEEFSYATKALQDFGLPPNINLWIVWNWLPLIKERMSHFFYGKGFYIFYFKLKEDKDLIFYNSPYFYNTRVIFEPMDSKF